MRLIDADEFLEYIEKEKALIPIDAEKYYIDEKVVDGMNAAIRAIENEIKEQPTAYDVEKVVEELEEHRANFQCKFCKHFYDGKDECSLDCTDALIDNLIDIVRRGGAE